MNPMSDKTAKAGTLLMISDGNYSSYQVKGFFVVLTEFQPKALLEEFSPESTAPDKPTVRHFEPTEFLAFLLKKGLLLEVSYGELCGVATMGVRMAMMACTSGLSETRDLLE